MCKKLFTSLLGGGSAPTPVTPAPMPDAPVVADADIKNTDVVTSLGGDPSGRVKLGGAKKKRSDATVGISI